MPHRVPAPRAFWPFAMGLMVLLLAANAVQSYRALQELVANEGHATTTQSVLRSIKNLYSAMQDAELGVRAYLLSGDDNYLKPYHQAQNDIQTHLSALAGYDYEREQQRRRIFDLTAMVKLRVQEMGEHIREKDQRPNSSRVTRDKLFESHQRMQVLRRLIDAAEAVEYELLDEQSAISRSGREELRLTIIVANSVGLLMIALIAILVRQALRHHRQEADTLEKLVQERTRELEHYSTELQRSNRELQDFAFVASHDLQEPLRKIRAFGDRLKSLYQGQLGNGEDYIDRMQSAALRMSRLIEDLLEFSRVSTRAKPFEEVDLNQVMGNVLDALEMSIQDSHADIQLDPLPVINADQTQMHQLFQNLLGNALKFVATDTRPHITISCRAQPEATTGREFFQIAIADNGIGFEPQYAEKIFTPFQRLHGRDQYAGTGIGLAVCRRIVERHQGTIDVTSQPGAGSTFVITLPAHPEQSLVGQFHDTQ